MNDDQFLTVFDAAHQGLEPWLFPAFGLLFVAAGWAMVYRPERLGGWRRLGNGRFRKWLGRFFLGFSVFWTVTACIDIALQQIDVRSALKAGRFAVVEGPVTHFVPMPYQGHAQESFEVDGHRFAYSDYVVTPGFRNTASHGGPIREGLYVRIAYAGNTILRLDVAQPAKP